MAKSWAAQRAQGLVKEGRATQDQLSIISPLFESYLDAKQAGKKPSYRSLGLSVGVHAPAARKYLLLAGLTPFRPRICNRRRACLPEELIKRAFRLPYTIKDIAAFIPASRYALQRKFSSLGTHHATRRFIRTWGIGRPMSYREASRIYQAYDRTRSLEQVCDALHHEARFVRFALERRGRYEPEILSIIRTLHPELTVDKPYLSALMTP